MISFKGILKRILTDKCYLKIAYRRKFGRKLNLTHPKSFNEKIQWLKLYNRRPIYTKMVDKYEVREYIKNTIGENYLIPIIGIWNKVEDICIESLPDKFVLKTTHDSGGIFICKDKLTFDWGGVKES